MLKIDRVVDLGTETDRRHLLQIAKGDQKLVALIEENLADYMRFFPQTECRHVYAGGMISIPAGGKRFLGYELSKVLDLTAALKRLLSFEGFSDLISGLSNPTQIAATIFEILVADWCRGRRISLDLKFSPSVKIGEHVKRPEFYWRTTLGEVFCECKRADFHTTSLSDRLDRMLRRLDELHKLKTDWNPSLRLEISVQKCSLNEFQRESMRLMEKAGRASDSQDPLGAIIQENNMTARFRPKGELSPREPETMSQSLVIAGTEPTDPSTSGYLTLIMDLRSYRKDAAAALLRRARKQLPAQGVGLIFLEGAGRGAATEKVQMLITQPAYESTPWISLWSQGEFDAAVWRNGQPFDNRVVS